MYKLYINFDRGPSKESKMAARKRCLELKKTLSCATCNKIFPEVRTLLDHKRIHEELATQKVPVHDLFERPYACDKCGKTFSSRRTLLKHLRLHSGVLPFSCSVCNKTFYQISKWIDHGRVHTGGSVFPCGFCTETFTRKDKFVMHLKRHALNPLRSGVRTEGIAFSQSGDMLNIGKESEKVYAQKCLSNTFPKEKDLSSGGASSASKNKVITHYSLFTYGSGYNPFSCSIEQLSSIAQDKRLLRREPFVCNFCLATFTRKESLKKHVDRVHGSKSGTRSTLCELCFKFFPKKDIIALVDLDENTYSVPYSAYGSRSNHGRNSVLLVLSCSSCMFACNKDCSLCEKTVRLCDLRTHLKLHTGELVPCEKCGKIFSDNVALRNHSDSCVAHCPICDKIFKEVTALNRHTESTHENDEDLFKSPLFP